MRAFVDRIEEGIATLLLGEDESVRVSVPVRWLPVGIREGTCLGIDFTIDRDSTEKAHDDVQSLLDGMENNP